MKILILGSEGSMGTRYRACLTHLGYSYDTFDVRVNGSFHPPFDKYTHVAICTPTHTHFELLKELIPMNKEILCEKPITKNIEELILIKNLIEKHKSRVIMMLQYSMLVEESLKHGSHYNYYKTGNDGLYWDCLQILHLSNDVPKIKNTSPIWSCAINGKELRIGKMDYAYVVFLQKWIVGTIKQDFDKIIKSHLLAKELQDEHDRNSKSCNRNSSKK